MRLVVVGAARGWHATRIAAEATRRGHGVTVVEWPLLGAAIPAARSDRSVISSVRTMAGALSCRTASASAT